MFGSVLDTIDPKYIDDATGIPRMIQDIFRQLENSGLSTKSLFHAPGNMKRIKELQRLYESASYDQIQVFEEHPHDLCALVIQYLQRLPEPLCTLLLYADFVEVHQKNQANHKDWVEGMRKLFNTLPEMNKRLLLRCLQFFSRVGENDTNETSLSYLSYLLGPLFFYDQVDAEEEDGEEAQIYYNKDLVYDLMMQLFQSHAEICSTPLEELPHWKKSRDMDSLSRLKKDKKKESSGSDNVVLPSYDPPTEDELKQEVKAEEEVIPVSSPGTAAAVKRKKGVIGTLKLSKLKQQYLGELPDTPPPGTTPVNYVMPAGYSPM